jgi:hypothetical protein
MTSDEELEHMALEYLSDACGEASMIDFKAGFRMAEKMMAERIPDEHEIDKGSLIYEDYRHAVEGPFFKAHQSELSFIAGVNWLKQKMLGDDNA